MSSWRISKRTRQLLASCTIVQYHCNSVGLSLLNRARGGVFEMALNEAYSNGELTLKKLNKKSPKKIKRLSTVIRTQQSYYSKDKMK